MDLEKVSPFRAAIGAGARSQENVARYLGTTALLAYTAWPAAVLNAAVVGT